MLYVLIESVSIFCKLCLYVHFVQCAAWSEGSMGNLRLTLRYEQGEKLSATVWGWGAQSTEIQGMLKQF